MLIEFKRVQAKNFLSYGDNEENNTLDLNIANMTLIGGKNGSGKSSLAVEAITFALHGKPFRKIKKDQLINSVNGKACEVRLWFEIAGTSYMVYRGIKPKRFQIYRKKGSNIMEFEEPVKLDNGDMDYKDMIPPLSDKEYQIKLDEIIQCSFNAFKQLIVLGSANHEGFMELDAAKRREIITQILDIEIFTEMSEILKGRVKDNSNALGETTSSKTMKENEISVRESSIEQLRSAHSTAQLESTLADEKAEFKRLFNNLDNNDELIAAEEAKVEEARSLVGVEEEKVVLAESAVGEAESKIEAEEAKVSVEEAKVSEEEKKVEAEEAKVALAQEKVDAAQLLVDAEMEKLKDYDLEAIKTEHEKIKTDRTTVEVEMKRNKDSAKFYFTNDDCKECGQIIHEDFKKSTLKDLKEKIETAESEISQFNATLDSHKVTFDEISAIRDSINAAKEGVTEAKQGVAEAQRGVDEAKKGVQNAKNGVERAKQNVVSVKQNVTNAKQGVENAKQGVERAKQNVENAIQGVENVKNTCASSKDNLKTVKASIERLEKLIEETKAKAEEEIKAANDELGGIKGDLDKINVEHAALEKEKQVHDIVKMLLKDNAIKAQVIKQWLPTINNQINEVLERLNADYAFMLDENFDETILSRYRDKFSYSSFSEGEKARISIAILFAFREVAMRKATVSTNILVLDEVGAELDIDSHQIMLQMLKETEGLSTFIITHKNTDNDIYDRVIEVEKEGNFSVLRSAV